MNLEKQLQFEVWNFRSLLVTLVDYKICNCEIDVRVISGIF